MSMYLNVNVNLLDSGYESDMCTYGRYITTKRYMSPPPPPSHTRPSEGGDIKIHKHDSLHTPYKVTVLTAGQRENSIPNKLFTPPHKDSLWG